MQIDAIITILHVKKPRLVTSGGYTKRKQEKGIVGEQIIRQL